MIEPWQRQTKLKQHKTHGKREWKPIEGFDFKEILFDEFDGIAKITINRPRYRNASRYAQRGR